MNAYYMTASGYAEADLNREYQRGSLPQQLLSTLKSSGGKASLSDIADAIHYPYEHTRPVCDLLVQKGYLERAVDA